MLAQIITYMHDTAHIIDRLPHAVRNTRKKGCVVNSGTSRNVPSPWASAHLRNEGQEEGQRAPTGKA